MGRIRRQEEINYANYRFDPVNGIDEQDRLIEVYNTRTSYDFTWLLNKLCKIEGVGYFIVRKTIFDTQKEVILRGDKIKLFGRFIRT